VNNQNHDIENLFKEKFKNFEKPAGDKVWAGVKAGIKTSAAATGTAAAAKSTLSIGTKMAFVAAFVAVAAISTYVLVNNNKPGSEITEQVPASKVESTENSATDEVTKEALLEELPVAPVEEVVEINQSDKVIEKKDADKQVDQKKSSTEKVGSSSEVKNQSNEKTSNSKIVEENHNPNDKPEVTAIKSDKNKSVKESKPTPNSAVNNVKAIESSIVVNSTKGEAPMKVDFKSENEAANYLWKLNGVTISNSKSSSYTIDSEGTYELQLAVTNQEGKQKITTEKITISPRFELNPPNIFTPNQDGQNDIFRIEGEFEKLEVIILDKTAKEIHNWEGEYGFWDGTKQDGSPAAEGTYFYIINYKVEGKKEAIKKGTLTLKR